MSRGLDDGFINNYEDERWNFPTPELYVCVVLFLGCLVLKLENIIWWKIKKIGNNNIWHHICLLDIIINNYLNNARTDSLYIIEQSISNSFSLIFVFRMELQNLNRLAPSSGFTLNIEEQSGLEVAMIQRKQEENLLGKFLFWGKIFGATQDYLITCIITTSEDFPEKKYYYWYLIVKFPVFFMLLIARLPFMHEHADLHMLFDQTQRCVF